ncbi:MAG: acyl-CoA thioesterase/BAAT N-terminal domain-containing protein [Acidimicrobiales bacterium]
MAAPSFHLSAHAVVVDEPVPIVVGSLAPRATVVVGATFAHVGRWWSARASFAVGEDGRVDLSKAAARSGSYRGVDPMGLVWSARPGPPPPGVTDRSVTVLSAAVGGREVATANLQRLPARPGVRVVPVRAAGLVGELHLPSGAGARPGVVVLGGAQGGLGHGVRTRAAGLASHGFAALALAYVGAEGLPDQLAHVPVEYVGTALRWLGGQPGVDGQRLGLLGSSRGAELALVAAANVPGAAAVVALAPPDVVWSGGAAGSRHRSAWTLNGEPLPFLDLRSPMVAARARRRDPAVEIPLERFGGAVLLVSGDADAVWPSSLMASRLAARAAGDGAGAGDGQDSGGPDPGGSRPYVRHLRCPAAGHWLLRPYHPTTALDGGGTAAGNARAAESSWTATLDFLGAHLGAG